MVDFFSALAENKFFFIIAFEVVLVLILILVCSILYKKVALLIKESRKLENRASLKNLDPSKATHEQMVSVVRSMIAPDGVDPAPNSYMCLNDGGKEVFVRTLTIASMQSRVEFAVTLRDLLGFPGVISSRFIEPIPDEKMGRMLDKQITILEAEEIAAEGNTNRVRKLRSQFRDAYKWAEEHESGEKKNFHVGFLFTFYADTLSDLNKKTDSFRSLALRKKIEVTNTYAMQPEAFLQNMPFNKYISYLSSNLAEDAVVWHMFDTESLSAIAFSFTSASFSHKWGVPLGRNMGTGAPFLFDLFDPSHDGFTLLLFGKTGSGKSATIKMFIERAVIQGMRFTAIDSQTRKGTSEGEYAYLAEEVGGVSYQISPSSSNILNIFDVQESTTYIKQSSASGYEQRTLDLASAISQHVNSLRTMMQASTASKSEGLKLDAAVDTDIDDILTTTVKEMFEELGIVHGNPDSLYMVGDVIVGGQLQSGVVPKHLPTMSMCYRKLLIKAKKNDIPDKDKAFRVVLNSLKEYVRELYYSPHSMMFFTREEYEQLEYSEEYSNRRCYYNEDLDDYELVEVLKGIRPYFDGQSTIAISNTCAFTNFDISQLSDDDRIVARQIAQNLNNEQFIKKNSENLSSSDKICSVVDEAHENFEYGHSRKSLANTARTARKRNAGLIFSTQTVKEYDRHPETQDIFKQATAKFVFKQDPQDKEYLMKTLNITDSQADYITKKLGVADAKDPDAKKRRRGEMCVVDGNNAFFCKVDYLYDTEKYSIETDAAGVFSSTSAAS